MEIEKKFLIHRLPDDLNTFNKAIIKQGYVSTDPVIRIRQKDKAYYLTVKSKGLMAREEFEIEIDETQFTSLSRKVDYHIIDKTRYFIPLDRYTIELDVFNGILEGLVLAEVEFTSIEEADSFVPPKWFREDVTKQSIYQNNRLCQLDCWAK